MEVLNNGVVLFLGGFLLGAFFGYGVGFRLAFKLLKSRVEKWHSATVKDIIKFKNDMLAYNTNSSDDENSEK